jgi:hypothetical protein
LIITGTDFGQNTATTVYVGGLVCPTTAPLGSFSLRRIVCVMPSNTGIQLNVTIVVANQTSNVVQVNYFPAILSVTSSTGTYPTNNTDQSVVLTVTGVNFGNATQTASLVTIGGVNCTTLVQQATRITCTMPSGSGTNWPLIVTVMGTASASVPFSYAAPTLKSISSTLGPAAGNQVLTLTGTNFGHSRNTLTATPVISIGASTCALNSYDDTTIICTTQPGSGTKLSVTVAVSTLTSNALLYSYAPPSITGMSPTHGPSNGGVLVTLTGINFASAAATSILVGNSLLTSIFQNDTYITFFLTNIGPTPQQVSLVVNQQTSNAVSFTYDIPTISSLTPTIGPTAGAPTVLVIRGDGFADKGLVYINGQVATSQISWNNTVVQVVAPPGQGVLQPLYIISYQTTSNSLNYSYFPPNIIGITPSNAPTLGGALLTVTGQSS